MTDLQLKTFDLTEGRFAPATIKNSKRFFKKVAGIAEINKLDLRKDAKEVVKKVAEEPLKISTQRTLFKAVVLFFQLRTETKTKHYKTYLKRVTDIEKEVDSKPKELTERQEAADYTGGLVKFIQFIDDSEFDLEGNRALLLFSFYLLQPPRRQDYVNMIYLNKFKGMDKDKNYLIEGKRHWTFVFNVFKTAKGFKQQRFKITNPILIKILENEEFENGVGIYNKSLRTFQRQILELSKEFFGEELAVQDLRVLHSTEEFKGFEDFFERLAKDSELMAHQISTKIKSYIRTRKQ